MMLILCILMCVDYLVAILLVLTGKRKPNSKTGFNGIISKCLILVAVGVIYLLEGVINYPGIHDIVILFFTVNEAVSIFENFTEFDVKLPFGIMERIKGAFKDENNTKESDNSEQGEKEPQDN